MLGLTCALMTVHRIQTTRMERVIAFDDVPLTKALRDALPEYFGAKTVDIKAEGNYYYDINHCGIGMHGDSERKIVVAARVGETIPLCYQWYHMGNPVSEKVFLSIGHGDIYAMSEKSYWV